jgi:hypothetical protein
LKEQQIEQKLRNLPKYSLSNGQKHSILQHLRIGQNKRKTKIRPGLPVALFSAIAITIILSLVPFQQSRDHMSMNESESRDMAEMETAMEFDMEAVEGKPFVLSDEKKHPPQEAIGIEGKVGILKLFDHFVAQDERRVAKLMLFFWGDPDLPGKSVEIRATNGREEMILAREQLGGGLYGEDAQILTRFQPFPTEGTWKLSFFVDEEPFGEFTLEVLPPFPATEHFTLVNSPKEMQMGKKSSVTIEGTGKDKKEKREIRVKLLNENGKVADQSVFVQNGEAIDAGTNKPIYFYEGKLKFPKKGTWILEIDGEKTKPFEN